ncbi:hypothetical protein RB595_001564 [Gaeumannomyces hyphopodioides]
MGATISAIKALIVPAVIALVIYLLLSFVVVPLWQRYQSRYSHYIPLDSITDRTSSLRQRLQDRIAQYLSPSSWRRDHTHVAVGDLADDTSDAGFDSEDGEELNNVVDDTGRRTELASRSNQPDQTTRLSRDLEQGFIDDSSSDSSGR